MTTISVIVGSTASRSFAFTGRLLTGDIFLSDLSKIPAYAGFTAAISGADLHWSIADREAHEKVIFHQGWPMCTEQLAILGAIL